MKGRHTIKLFGFLSRLLVLGSHLLLGSSLAGTTCSSRSAVLGSSSGAKSGHIGFERFDSPLTLRAISMGLISLTTGLNPIIAVCVGGKVDQGAIVELVRRADGSPELLVLLIIC